MPQANQCSGADSPGNDSSSFSRAHHQPLSVWRRAPVVTGLHARQPIADTRSGQIIELDYESGWQDAVELGRLGQKLGIQVEFREYKSVAIRSPAALAVGLARPKTTFRQRNLYCQFDLGRLPAGELERLEAKAEKLGDYILAGHLLREADAIWLD